MEGRRRDLQGSGRRHRLQTNVITKVLQCPETTSARSTDNSGEFAKIRCHCDDKAGCPAKK